MRLQSPRRRGPPGGLAVPTAESWYAGLVAVTPFAQPLRVLGRYALYGKIASGGMATVHLGRLLGPVGFARTVAIKCLHPVYAKNPEFAAMFLDEARVAARIRHPNVVQTLDVVKLEGELFLVMDYVQGESFAKLLTASAKLGERVSPQISVPIIVSVLHGLHAAHEATNERGEPLGIVHRDVSPHNVMVGVDGVARVLDFGVAKASGRVQSTRAGQLKGKIPYMSPEQLGGKVDRASDIYACSVVLWEALTSRRLFLDESEVAMMAKIADGAIVPPTQVVPDLAPELEAIVMRGLAKNPADRFETARDMARALEKSVPLATTSDIGEWVERLAGANLEIRASFVKEMESHSLEDVPPSVPADRDSGEFELRDTVITKQPEGARDAGPASSAKVPAAKNEEATTTRDRAEKSDAGVGRGTLASVTKADGAAKGAVAATAPGSRGDIAGPTKDGSKSKSYPVPPAAKPPVPEATSAAKDPPDASSDAPKEPAAEAPAPADSRPPVKTELDVAEAMPTQFSSGSLSVRPEEPPQFARGIKIGLLSAAGIIVTVAAAALILGRSPAPPPAVAPTYTPTPIPHAVDDAAPAGEDARKPETADSAQAAARADAAPPARDVRSADPSGAGTADVPARDPVTQPRTPRPRNPCVPPYTVDAAGFKHYKRECVK